MIYTNDIERKKTRAIFNLVYRCLRPVRTLSFICNFVWKRTLFWICWFFPQNANKFHSFILSEEYSLHFLSVMVQFVDLDLIFLHSVLYRHLIYCNRKVPYWRMTKMQYQKCTTLKRSLSRTISWVTAQTMRKSPMKIDHLTAMKSTMLLRTVVFRASGKFLIYANDFFFHSYYTFKNIDDVKFVETK